MIFLNPTPSRSSTSNSSHKAFLSRIQKCDEDGLVKYATYSVQMAARLTSSRPPSLGQSEKERMLEDHSSTLGRKMVYDADDRPAFWPQPMTGWSAYEVSAFSLIVVRGYLYQMCMQDKRTRICVSKLW
ncbi:hypothetical protein TNCV_3646161 [Trichonephila clavipes]|nr:hypothetical protein TNCV_3646161 [Trichonephila clavipes]